MKTLRIIISFGTVLTASVILAESETPVLPTGGTITHGQGIISASPNQLTITQNSQVLDTAWSGFDIGAGGKVSVVQPNQSATFIGRINSGGPSNIDGTLTANGRVVLVNPNGIIFGKDSQINAAGLVASSLGLSNYDAHAGRFSFEGSSGSILQHNGVIRSDYIALIGNDVRQAGSIVAESGDVALLAGENVEIAIGGSGLISAKVNARSGAGTIDALGSISAEAGNVLIRAEAASELLSQAIHGDQQPDLVFKDGRLVLVETAGSIEASNITVDAGDVGAAVVSGNLTAQNANDNAGGEIRVLGGAVHLEGTASVEASGVTGGVINIGGSWQNRDSSVRQSLITRVDTGAQLRADAWGNGDGGEIVVWSDVKNVNSLTTVAGSLTATSLNGTGVGGRIETSGATLDLGAPYVDTRSALNGSGLWLIDPTDYQIRAEHATNIANALNTSNVEITTTNVVQAYSTFDASSVDSGNIWIAAPIDVTSTNGNYLLLHAENNIRVDLPITMASGDLILSAGADIVLKSSANLNLSDTSVLTLSAGGNIGDETVSFHGYSRSVDPGWQHFGYANITADKLRIINTGAGYVELSSLKTDINTLAVEGVSDISFGDIDDVSIGTVATTLHESTGFASLIGSTAGISASGQVSIRTDQGNINVLENIATTRNGYASISLITAVTCGTCTAGYGRSVSATGGDITIGGNGGFSVPTNTQTLAPEILLFTGSVSGSTSLLTYFDGTSGSPQIRYGTNNALLGSMSGTDYTPSDGTIPDRADLDMAGAAVLYRESPVVRLTVSNGNNNVITYGDIDGSLTGLPFDVNGNYVHYSSGDWWAEGSVSRGAASLPNDFKFVYLSDDGIVSLTETQRLAAINFANQYLMSNSSDQSFWLDTETNSNGGPSGGLYGGGTNGEFGLSVQPIPGFDHKIYSIRDYTTEYGVEKRTFTDDGYTLVYDNDAVFTVNPRPITPVFHLIDKTYDGNTVAQTSGVDGLNYLSDFHWWDNRGDNDFVSWSASVNYDDKNVVYDGSGEPTSKNVTATVILSGAHKDYYTIVQPSGLTAKILPKQIMLQAEKIYDASTIFDASAIQLSGLLGQETLLISGSAIANSGTVVGATALTDISNLNIGNGTNGGLVQNYKFGTGAVLAPATVTPRPVNIAVEKVYDGNRQIEASEVTISTGISEEQLSLSISGYRPLINASNVSLANALTSYGGLALANGSGGDVSNYTLPNLADVSVSVLPYTLTPTAPAATKTYDGTTGRPVDYNLTLSNQRVAFDANMRIDVEYIGASFGQSDVTDSTSFTLTGGSVTSATTSTSIGQGVLDDVPLPTDFTVASSLATTGRITPYIIGGTDMSFSVSGHPYLATLNATNATISVSTGENISFVPAAGTSLSVHKKSQSTDFYLDNNKLVGTTIYANGAPTSNYAFITSTSFSVADQYLVDGSVQNLKLIARLDSSTYTQEYSGSTAVAGSFDKNYWAIQNVDTGEIYPLATKLNYEGAPMLDGSGVVDIHSGLTFSALLDAADAGSRTIAVSSVAQNSTGTFYDTFNRYYNFVDSQISAEVTPRVLNVDLAYDGYDIRKYYDGTADIADFVRLSISNASDIVAGDNVTLATSQVLVAVNHSGAPIINSTDGRPTQVVLPTTTSFGLEGSDAVNYVAKINDTFENRYPTLRVYPAVLSLSATKTQANGSDFSLDQVTLSGVVTGENITLSGVSITAEEIRAASLLNIDGVDTIPDPSDQAQIDYFVTNYSATEEQIVNYLTSLRYRYDNAADAPALAYPFLAASLNGDILTEESSPGTYTLVAKELPTGDLSVELVSPDSSALASNYCLVDCDFTDGSRLSWSSVYDDTDSVSGRVMKGLWTAIIEAPPTISLSLSGFTLLDKVYDGTTAGALSLVSNWGVLGGNFSGADQSTVALDYSRATLTFDQAGVGSNVNVTVANLGLTGTNASAYSLSNFVATAGILARPLTLSATAAAKTYGDVDPSLSVSASAATSSTGLVSGDLLSEVTGTLSRESGEAVGSYDIRLGAGSKAANYAISFASDNNAFTIAQRQITLSAAPVTKIYGDADPSLSVAITSGSLANTTVTDTLSDVVGTLSRQTGTNVGSYDIRLGTGASAANYDISFETDNNAFSITARPLTATGSVADRMYDGTDAASVSLALANLVGAETLSTTVGARFGSSNVGTQTATVSSVSLGDGSGLASNYSLNVNDITLSNSGQADILPKRLLATASVADKVYDKTDTASVTLSLSGLVGEEDLSQTVTASFDSVLAGSRVASIGSFALLDGAMGVAANYSLSRADIDFSNTRASILRKPLTVSGSATAVDKVYDGTTSVTADLSMLTFSGLVLGDSVGVANAVLPDANVGTDKPLIVTFAGGDGANYIVPNITGLMASVTPKSLTGIASVSGRTYNGSRSADVTVALDGLVSGEGLAYDVIAVFDDAEAGMRTASILNFTLQDHTGRATNYSLALADISFEDNTAMITAAAPLSRYRLGRENVLAQVPSAKPLLIRSDGVEDESLPLVQRPLLQQSFTYPTRVVSPDTLRALMLETNETMLIVVSDTSSITSVQRPEPIELLEDEELEIPLSDVIPALSFTDETTVVVSLPNGVTPNWVQVDRARGSVTVRAPSPSEGTQTLRLGVADLDGNMAAVSLRMFVRPNGERVDTVSTVEASANSLRIVGSQTAVQNLPGFLSVQALRPTRFSAGSRFVFEVPNGTFVHENSGEPLRFVATLADGTPLPSWMTFDPETQTFSGQAPEGVATQLDVIVKAIDSASQEAQVQLRVEVS